MPNFRRYTIFWVILLASSIVISVVQGRDSTNQSLPNCQEDEFLYPEDYEGPGKNEAEDYICIHFDEILDKAEAAIIRLDPNNAVILKWDE